MKYEFYAHDSKAYHRIFEDLVQKIESYELEKIKAVLAKELIRYLKEAENTEIDETKANAFAADDNYAKVLEVYSTVSYWNTLKKEGGYNIRVTDVYSERDGWVLVFELDISKISKNQSYYAFGMLMDQDVFKVFK